MKPYKARELEDALKKKGFALDRATDDKIYYLWFEGRKTQVWTKISHGSGEELRFRLLKLIQRQLCLDTQAQLRDFIEGGMDGAAYISFLITKGVIIPPKPPASRR